MVNLAPVSAACSKMMLLASCYSGIFPGRPGGLEEDGGSLTLGRYQLRSGWQVLDSAAFNKMK